MCTEPLQPKDYSQQDLSARPSIERLTLGSVADGGNLAPPFVLYNPIRTECWGS